ncbi:hypothetical protein FOA52_004240 [Chlamydomonas sp. UWO 241]|nr:hypothetical protein FOA52_004240 [Chlamydomonas sp. UWO 241]
MDTPLASPLKRVAQTEELDTGGNALERALKSVDRSLDELEDNPLPGQRELYNLSRGPVGTATGQGLKVAADVAVKATVAAAKAVAPHAKWALAEGTKAAAGLVKYAILQAAKSSDEDAKRNRAKEAGKGKPPK